MKKPNAIGYMEHKLSGASSTNVFYFGRLIKVCKMIGDIKEIDFGKILCSMNNKYE